MPPMYHEKCCTTHREQIKQSLKGEYQALTGRYGLSQACPHGLHAPCGTAARAEVTAAEQLERLNLDLEA